MKENDNLRKVCNYCMGLCKAFGSFPQCNDCTNEAMEKIWGIDKLEAKKNVEGKTAQIFPYKYITNFYKKNSLSYK